MDWIKKQIAIAQEGIAANTGGENSSVESEANPLHNKGILIMYCHVIKDDLKIQKNLHLDFYSGQIYFTKGNRFVKSFTCSDIVSMSVQAEVLIIDYKKKYQITNRQKKIHFASNFESTQIRNHLKFIGENGLLLRKLFLLIDRDSIDNITVPDLLFTFHMHDIAVTEEQCKQICDKVADPKEIITTHLVDSDDCFDYIQFFHTFYRLWIERDENYAPKTMHECLLNWLYNSTTSFSSVDSKGSSEELSSKIDTLEIDEVSNVDSSAIVELPILERVVSHTPQSDIRLMSGETCLKKYKYVRWYIGPKPKAGLPSYSGNMLLSDYRVILTVAADCRGDAAHSRFRSPPFFNRIDVPLHSLYRACVDSTTGSLLLMVKDCRSIHIQAASKSKRQFSDEVAVLIHRYAFPGSMRQLKLFAFRGRPSEMKTGWSMSDLNEDYRRMGITACSEWRLFDNGADYKLCDTYPPLLVVPAKLRSTALYAVAEHRSKGRLPVVTYRHRNGAVLLRSSQPLVGITKKSSSEDGLIMECFRLREKIMDNRGSNIGPKLYILDLRRQIAAAVNMVAGKGTEDISEYTNTELIFCNIENIHVMRGSLSSLGDIICAGTDNDISFNSKLEESGWLKHLSLLLSSCILAAEKIHLEEATVLNHCSDGFDRTSQTCALTQILLDPYYRTIEGFACLIEKDWCAFGHKFKDRCGHGLDFNVTPDERSPVFLQFLDAVHQILLQFPTAFEYNQQMLVYVADHSTSGLYGNFIGNCYRQRMTELRVHDCTQSIWSVIFKNKSFFCNTLYKAYSSPIWPSSSMKKIRLWERYFLRWDPSCHPNGLGDDAWTDSWDDLEM